MEEKKPYIPQLTLDPNPVQEETTEAVAEVPVKTVEELIIAGSNLSPEELAVVEDFAKTIDITNSAQIMQ
ncbi:MAG: toxic anion resistance protein, partial [Clostridia bacterium]|nr:toxic anion resistance protein [Clostridia bacterium]